jgi:hypothetical protein
VYLKQVSSLELIEIDPNDPTLRCDVRYNYVANQDNLVVQMKSYLRYETHDGLIVPFPRDSGDRDINAVLIQSGVP